MHNRARLVVASFLTKDLGIDWRARRIYNPARHMERFDPEGHYVRRYVPELATVPDRYLREPWNMPKDVQRKCGCLIGRDYPWPIVDHRKAREEAFERYQV
jgi:deoxyribodipyrimidine photo-lyase